MTTFICFVYFASYGCQLMSRVSQDERRLETLIKPPKKKDLLIVIERFRCHFKKFVKISYRCVSAVSNLLRVNSVIPAGIWP